MASVSSSTAVAAAARRCIAVKYLHLLEATSTMTIAATQYPHAARDAAVGNGGAQPPPSHLPSWPRVALCVTAGRQTQGQGTGGREWSSPPGNTYMTLALPADAVPADMLPVFPLVVGLSTRRAVTEFLHRKLQSASAQVRRSPPSGVPTVHLKWPNDILIDQKKLSGSLIKSVIVPCDVRLEEVRAVAAAAACDEEEREIDAALASSSIQRDVAIMLIGIGVNVCTVPPSAQVTANGGRAATSLADVIAAAATTTDAGASRGSTGAESAGSSPPSNSDVAGGGDPSVLVQPADAIALAEGITAEIMAAIAGDERSVVGGGGGGGESPASSSSSSSLRERVVSHYREAIDWKCVQYLRRPVGTSDGSSGDGGRGPAVVPVRIGEWGELHVRHVLSGKEEILMADYLL